MISPRIVCLSLPFFALLGALGCGSPLVGLECREGYTACGHACYDLASDPQHCGGCGIACGQGQTCAQNACVDVPPGDGGSLADGGLDGGEPDGGDAATDGSVEPDTGAPAVPCTGPGSPLDCACDLGELKCDLTCVDGLKDTMNCGECGRACAPTEVCAAGRCAVICDGNLTLCGDVCVNTDEDVAHCGGCDNPACAPGAACVEGTCIGSAVGHVVAIGHDMSARRPPMVTLVGNAVFLARRAPVRVLMYQAKTSLASRNGIAEAITMSAASLGRSREVTEATASQLTLQLANADVLVIAPQQDATNDELQMLATEWSSAVRSFLTRGGVVLLFDAVSPTNDGTYQLVTVGGFSRLPVMRILPSTLPRPRLRLVSFNDAIAAGMPDEYQSEGLTVRFDLFPSFFPVPVEVVEEEFSGPVVIHVAPVR